MDSSSFRARVVGLVQKSRKALRLYTSMGRLRGVTGAEFSDIQLAEWREVNATLIKDVTAALEAGNSKKLAADIYILRDKYYQVWREIEASLHVKQKELVALASSSDYVKAAILSRELVQLKAQMQATQAVHHEVQDVIRQSKVRVPTIELVTELAKEYDFDSEFGTEVSDDSESDTHFAAVASGSKVIPLRR